MTACRIANSMKGTTSSLDMCLAMEPSMELAGIRDALIDFAGAFLSLTRGLEKQIVEVGL